MKRGTTPTLPIRINADIENIQIIEFIFSTKVKLGREILRKKFEEPFPLDNDYADEGFVILVPFTASETMRFESEYAFMDTRIVFNNGTIPQTEIKKINIKDTLFKEVYDDDTD